MRHVVIDVPSIQVRAMSRALIEWLSTATCVTLYGLQVVTLPAIFGVDVRDNCVDGATTTALDEVAPAAVVLPLVEVGDGALEEVRGAVGVEVGRGVRGQGAVQDLALAQVAPGEECGSQRGGSTNYSTTHRVIRRVRDYFLLIFIWKFHALPILLGLHLSRLNRENIQIKVNDMLSRT